MKHSFRRILSAVLVLSMLLSLAAMVVSCGGGGEDTSAPTTATPSTTTGVPGTTAPVTTLPSVTVAPPVTTAPVTSATPVTTTAPVTTAPVVPPEPVLTKEAVEGLAEYSIVYPEILGDEAYEAALALQARILEVTGLTLPLVSDAVAAGGSVPTDTKEILLGATNRVESGASSVLLRDDYRILYTQNGRYVVLAGSEAALCEAIAYMTENLLADGNLSYVVGGYVHYAEYPLAGMTVAGIPIEKYTIVRDAENAALATYLRDTIASLSGAVLPIMTDEDPETTYEFLIGNTGRLETGRAVADGHYAIGVDGSKVVLYGDGKHPAYYATIRFINDHLDGSKSMISVKRTEYDNSLSGMTAINLPTELEKITLENTENTGGVFERFLKTKEALPTEVTVLERVLLSEYPLSGRRAQLYVSPDGNDENPGTIDAPLATLSRALYLMGGGGGVIWVRGGTYTLDSAVNITSAVSGTETCPLFIKAYEGETPIFTTYKTIEVEWFEYTERDDEVAARLPDESIDEVMYVDLADHGFTLDDLTELVSTGDGYDVNGDGRYTESRYRVTPILLMGGREYEICRYPNADEPLLAYSYAYDSGRVTSSTGSEIYYTWLDRCREAGMDPLTPVPWSITLGERTGTERNKGKAIEQTDNWERYAPILDWVDTGNIWFYGRVYSDWDVGAFNVRVGKQLDENGYETGVHTYAAGMPGDYAITSTMPTSLGAYTFSNDYKAGHQHEYYLFNAIEALDAPGEWFLDVENEKLRLYVYPTDEWYDGEFDEISYTGGYSGSAFVLNNVKNLVIDGLTFRGIGQNAIYDGVSSSVLNNIVIQNCTFSNTGSNGVQITALATNFAVIYNSFSQSHGGMVSLTNRAYGNMIPDHNVIQNNTFGDPTPNHQNGITFAGCMTVVSHNYLVNTTIHFSNAYECIVEYNEMIGGSEDVGDGGQIYTYGLHSRGNHIRYNRCHGLNFSGNNIYNDGMCSGNYSYYNICSTLTGYRDGVQKCFYVSTGHNNVCYNNLFIIRSKERRLENILSVTGKPSTGTSGDCGMYESTLFYADTTDEGYGKRDDSASYSWDQLYRAAAEKYTGVTANATFDLERFADRFPNFVDSMEGALKVFQKMDELGKEYDRRTAVLAMEALFDETVETLMAEGKTRTEAEAEAWRLGYGYTEDFFRQPAYNVYKNNIILGGDAPYYFDSDNDGIYGEVNADFVFSDYLNNKSGFDDFGNPLPSDPSANDPFAKDMRVIENNYYNPDFSEILYDADPEDAFDADYEFTPGSLETILDAIPDFEELEYYKQGLTDWSYYP